jgi:hypothetical protein
MNATAVIVAGVEDESIANTVNEFDDDEEGFIDVSIMNDDGVDLELDVGDGVRGDIHAMGGGGGRGVVPVPPPPDVLDGRGHRAGEDDSDDDDDDDDDYCEEDRASSSSRAAEMIMPSRTPPPPPSGTTRDPSPPYPTFAMMRSRLRNKSGGESSVGGFSDDSGGSGGGGGGGGGGGSRSSRLCLKRKKSNVGGVTGGVYERIEDTDHHHRRRYNPSADDDDTDDDGPPSSHPTVSSPLGGGSVAAMGCSKIRRFCIDSSRHALRTTVSVMNFVARMLLWGSFVAMIVGVVWYSRELKMNGTDSHLIAWFSAGAFVLLGFPIAMCGIIMHLKNYYQPNVQCYVVRILWMVPIYSIESWLCLRFHTYAIYVETLRDFYESFVLLSFFQFLVEVLGGEEALVLMLKDKSPTRGAHIWGLGYCVRPWVMGQPVSLPYAPNNKAAHGGGGPISPPRVSKRVRWTSPFFVRCKFGVLQYVLLKFTSAIFVMLLEMYGLYKEGDFTPRGGYLYICILTNLSQCWALYCLVFFYYALKNELGPIRPVGKFISVKALVFFTWWQSLGISILFQMGMIPHYTSFDNGREWTSEAVAKGLQDWLICIEMFVAAIVHTFVFPHTDYLEPLGIVQRAGHHTPNGVRRLGRKGRHGYRRGDDKSAFSKSSGETEYGGGYDVELGPLISPTASQEGNDFETHASDCSTVYEADHKETSGGEMNYMDGLQNQRFVPNSRHERQGFVRALLDSTLLPRDVLDESVGIFKGEFNVEKKTLFQHAATSDDYDLFSRSSKRQKAKLRTAASPAAPKKTAEGRSHASEGVPDSVLLND